MTPSNFRAFEARAAHGGTVTASAGEILIHGEIGFGGVMAADVRSKLKAAGASPTVNINSPGGDVFEGIAVYNALREIRGVRVVVDGLAASAASIIAMAGARIEMAQGSFVMAHDPWGLTVGTAEDMRGTAEALDKVAAELAGIYAKRTGMTVARVAALMRAETWFNSTDAIEAGFADAEVDTEAQFAAFDLSMFRCAPRIPMPESVPDKHLAERALRDAGLSRRKAAALVNAGWPAISDPTHDTAPLLDIAAALRT